MKQNTVNEETNPENIFKESLEEIVRVGAQKMLQKALELEIEEFISQYQYILDDNGNRKIVRNGYSNPRKIITGAGPITIQTPRVDDRDLTLHNEPRFKSAIIPPYLRKTKNIEELLPVLYLKGISTGDFREALESITGKNAVGFSASTIASLRETWRKEYEHWSSRDLSNKEYVYWWADGIYFNVRSEEQKQCILVVIGLTVSGKKELIAIDDGYRESKESWKSLMRHLKRMGLKNGPKVAIGDGFLGFWAALQEEFSQTKHQLCWVHKTVNVLDKLPKNLHEKAKKMIHNIYLSEDKKSANSAFDIFIEEFALKYEKAVDSLRNHREQLLTFYNCPAEHWKSIRSTNVIESTFSTVRLRTNKTRNCCARSTILTMVFKLIQSAEKRWSVIGGVKKIEQLWHDVVFIDGIESTENKTLELAKI